MGRLRTRAIVLVVVVALLPLTILGVLSIERAREELLAKARINNTSLAQRAGDEIVRQVDRFEEILQKLAIPLSPTTHLSPEQASRILRSYRIETRELMALDFVREGGREWATGRVDDTLQERGDEEAVREALGGRNFRSPVKLSRELVPQLTIAVPLRSAGRVVGALVATVDITEMWRVVDSLNTGGTYARVVGQDGTLLAIGKNELKRNVFNREKDDSSEMVRRVLGGEAPVLRYAGYGGEEVLGIGQPIRKLGWGLILEEPVKEALMPYYRLRTRIVWLGAVLLLLAALSGFLGARSIVEPIERLRLRAGEIARGLLEARVEVRSPEELAALAEAMNHMSAELIRLQDDLRKKERIATLGRLAAGLAHDLKHPVRALQVNARLVLDRPNDPEVRRVFGEVVQREFRRLERFLEDLKRVSQGGAIEFSRDQFDAALMMRDFVAEQKNGNAPACVEIEFTEPTEGLPVVGNRELLGRVLSNLASNAYEAMEGEGTLRLSVGERAGAVELRVADSGPGIPAEKRKGLFSDFETTKRRGLGLGLAVTKKIVDDHGGTIDVESEPGQGAVFVIRLPRSARTEAA